MNKKRRDQLNRKRRFFFFILLFVAVCIVGVVYNSVTRIPTKEQEIAMQDSKEDEDKNKDENKDEKETDSKEEQTPTKDNEPGEKEQTPTKNDDISEGEEQKQNEGEELKTAFAQEKKSFNLLLANVDNPLPQGFSAEVEEVQNGFKLDSRVAPKARKMIEDAKNAGVDLMVCSAYRSMEKQTTLFEQQTNIYISAGKDEDEARALTASAIAVPGTSEHQTGLAADIVTPEYQTLDEGFAETEAFRWLNQNAWKYGFILRYPKDKQEVTKIIYESWHYRYVGEDHAKRIKDSGICLEEYLQLEIPDNFSK